MCGVPSPEVEVAWLPAHDHCRVTSHEVVRDAPKKQVTAGVLDVWGEEQAEDLAQHSHHRAEGDVSAAGGGGVLVVVANTANGHGWPPIAHTLALRRASVLVDVIKVRLDAVDRPRVVVVGEVNKGKVVSRPLAQEEVVVLELHEQ